MSLLKQTYKKEYNGTTISIFVLSNEYKTVSSDLLKSGWRFEKCMCDAVDPFYGHYFCEGHPITRGNKTDLAPQWNWDEYHSHEQSGGIYRSWEVQ